MKKKHVKIKLTVNPVKYTTVTASTGTNTSSSTGTMVLEKAQIVPITHRFASDDLNIAVDKINEIIAHLNSVL